MRSYLKLMLFMPLLRLMMCADEVDIAEGKASTPDYTELDELVVLHARAMLHMNKLGWPLGSTQSVQVGAVVSRSGLRLKATATPVFESMFGISAPGGIVVMRSGAIYGRGHTFKENVPGGSHMTPPTCTLDMTRMDHSVRSDVRRALEHMLAVKPQPMFID